MWCLTHQSATKASICRKYKGFCPYRPFYTKILVDINYGWGVQFNKDMENYIHKWYFSIALGLTYACGIQNGTVTFKVKLGENN